MNESPELRDATGSIGEIPRRPEAQRNRKAVIDAFIELTKAGEQQ